MTTKTKDEALKLALEAFSQYVRSDKTYAAITAIKEALAQKPVDYDKEELRGTVWDTSTQAPAQPEQPEQEPVATVQCIHGVTIGYLEVMQPVGTKLYTSPPRKEWVGLTDEEVQAMDSGANSISSFYAGALWANEKLKEKNT